MDSIVSKLSEIEAAANAIVENAEASKSLLEKEMQEKRNQFDAELEVETQKKIEAIQTDLEAKMAEILKSQEEKNQITIASLEKDYEEHHEQYAKEILQHIIEV